MARNFGNAVDRLLSGGGAQCDCEQIRDWLVLWRDNDAKLEPTLQRSFLLQEAVPLSQDLSRLGSIGLEALDHLSNKRAASASWTSEQLRFLENAKKPRAELLIMVVPGVQRLVEDAGHAH